MKVNGTYKTHGTYGTYVWLLCLSVCLNGCRVRTDDCAPCPAADRPAEVPTINVPPGARMSNYAGGSCVHASIETLLNWQGHAELARWWRATHSGGEYAESFAAKLNAAGVRFAHTTNGDEEFLAWSIRTRRGAAVSWPAGHMVCLVHLDGARAGILDNNDTRRVRWVDRRTFVHEWRACGGWAVTPVYSPAAPVPFRRAENVHHGGTEHTERRRQERARTILPPKCLLCVFRVSAVPMLCWRGERVRAPQRHERRREKSLAVSNAGSLNTPFLFWRSMP
ncbi:MAG: hypothetical protein ACYC35_05055 [Pirellulales bacterium]